MKLMCQECGKSIDGELVACPTCGARPIRKSYVVLAYLIGALVLLIAITVIGGF